MPQEPQFNTGYALPKEITCICDRLPKSIRRGIVDRPPRGFW